MNLSDYPTAILYTVIGLLTGAFGIGMIVWQTGATQRALTTRRSLLAGGVVLALIGAFVVVIQIFVIVLGSYSGLPTNAP